MSGNDRVKGRKTSIPIYEDTLFELDKRREVYNDGSKENWDHFLRRMIEGKSE